MVICETAENWLPDANDFPFLSGRTSSDHWQVSYCHRLSLHESGYRWQTTLKSPLPKLDVGRRGSSPVSRSNNPFSCAR